MNSCNALDIPFFCFVSETALILIGCWVRIDDRKFLISMCNAQAESSKTRYLLPHLCSSSAQRWFRSFLVADWFSDFCSFSILYKIDSRNSYELIRVFLVEISFGSSQRALSNASYSFSLRYLSTKSGSLLLVLHINSEKSWGLQRRISLCLKFMTLFLIILRLFSLPITLVTRSLSGSLRI